MTSDLGGFEEGRDVYGEEGFMKWYTFLWAFVVVVFGGPVFGREIFDVEFRMTSFLDAGSTVFELFDGQTNTAWVEGVEGDGSGTNGEMVWDERGTCVVRREGVGEYIEMWSSPHSVDKIIIYNGDQKDKGMFFARHRVKEMGIFVQEMLRFFPSNYVELPREVQRRMWKERVRERLIHVKLKDKMGAQAIPLNASNVTYIRFTILSTYPGTNYDETAISEIEFWYRGQKDTIIQMEKSKETLLEEWKEAQWERMLGYVVDVHPGGVRDMSVYFGVGEIFEVEGAEYAIHDMVRRSMEAEGFQEISWTNAEAESVLCWKLDGGKLMYQVTDMKGAAIKNWQEIRPIKKIGEWRMDENGVIFIREIGGEWERMSAEEWLTKRYGDYEGGYWNDIPNFAREFLGGRGEVMQQSAWRKYYGEAIKVHPLVELWKQGKLKVPER